MWTSILHFSCPLTAITMWQFVSSILIIIRSFHIFCLNHLWNILHGGIIFWICTLRHSQLSSELNITSSRHDIYDAVDLLFLCQLSLWSSRQPSAKSGGQERCLGGGRARFHTIDHHIERFAAEQFKFVPQTKESPLGLRVYQHKSCLSNSCWILWSKPFG